MKNDSKFKLCLYKLSRLLPDKVFVKLKYRKSFNRWPNLKHPRTFNEKLNWLKLNDHNPIYPTLVDKDLVKTYVGKLIGANHIIQTYGVWDKPEDIDFHKLPKKFVLKATHDSGRVIICKNKADLDLDAAREMMAQSLARDFYAVTREWPYKLVKPRIIAEELLETPNNENLADYKVHCFNGEPKFILVCRDRFEESGLCEDFYDCEWNHLDVKRPNHSNAKTLESRPVHLELMLKFSKVLSKGFPFMRTDFYITDDNIYFGEITLYPASGSVPFVPNKFDEIFGDYLTLPTISQ